MKCKKNILFSTLLLSFFVLGNMALTQSTFSQSTWSSGPSGFSVNSFHGVAGELPQGEINTQGSTVPRGEVPDPALLERVRNKILPIGDGKNIQQVPINNNSPNSVLYDYSFAGPNQNGWVPADNNIAVGSGYIVCVTNEQYHVYNSNSLVLLGNNTLQNLFNSAADTISSVFDPKVVYDGWTGRFLILAFGKTNTRAIYYLYISQTSNPLGGYWYYKFPAHVNGSGPTNNWADYPGLAFGDGDITHGAVYITSNQYLQGGGFQYSKIRILQKNQIYNGSSANWYDFWNMTDANADKTFTLKPARTWWGGYGSASSEYLLNTKWYGSNVVTLWRIDNPTTSPALVLQATVSVTGYSIPPAAPQMGGSGTIDAFDNRTQDIIYSKGQIFAAWVSSYNWGSGNNAIVQYDMINVSTNVVNHEIRFGTGGVWFMFPSVAPAYRSPYFGNDSVGIAFSISSSSMYPSSSVIGYDGSGLTSYYTLSGSGYLGSGLPNRFGDYSGIAVDPAQIGDFFGFSMLARAGYWGSGIHHFSFSSLTGIQTLNNEIPKSYSLKQNYPNPFNPSTKIDFSIPKSGFVSIKVFDILGRSVKTLVNEQKQAGNYSVNFDASSVPSGVYFYKITSDNFSETKKMMLIK